MACPSAAGRSPPVLVDGRNLTIAGAPIYIKGVAWSPFDVSRSPNLGHQPDYSGFVGQDAPLMQAAGINVVRTYDTVDAATLDVLWSHGISVIMTVFLDAGYGHTPSTATTTVCALKAHPAVLMWAVANEPNYYSVSTSYTSDIASAVAAIKAADSTRPVAVVWGEMASSAVLTSLPSVDVRQRDSLRPHGEL
jgi:beta-galactosidase/beta-glucuronidase